MTTLRELFVSVKIDPAQAKKSLEQIDKKIDETTKSVDDVGKKTSASFSEVGKVVAGAGMKIGAAMGIAKAAIVTATAAVASFTNEWSKHVIEVDSTAKKYGLSAAALGEYQYALKALGGDADAAGELFKEMSIRLTEFDVTGAGPASDAMKALGLNIKELMRLDPEKRFERLADEIANVRDAGQRVFLADSLFGEEGAIKGAALIEVGSKRIRELRDEASALGGTLSGSAVQAAKSLAHEMLRLDQVIEGLKNTIGPVLVPVVRDLVHQFAEWVRANKDVIATRIAEFVEKLAKYAADAVPMIASLVDGLTGVIDKVGGLENALGASAVAWGAWQIAALAALGPVGQGVAALAAGVGIATLGLKNIGDAKKNKIAEDSEATDLLGQYLTRAAKENPTETTGDSRIDIARTQFVNAVIAAKNSGAFEPGTSRNDSMLRERKWQLDNMEKKLQALDELWADDAAHAAMVNATPFDSGTKLRNISNKAAAKQGPKTLEQIIADIDKQQREREFYKAQEERAQGLLGGTDGSRRMVVEQAIAELRKLSGRPETMSFNELIANAIGQGTGLGGGMLRPSGTGTTVNNIDASLKFEIGGIRVELPAEVTRNGDPMSVGRSVGEQIADALKSYTRQGYDAQIGQIIG